ncbi:MAG: hypothetical protein CMH30_00905 [Micavibrio sp.]|nr:hypothetical protein [Micavibrio sp.]|tara:strand:+ start:4420 stop:5355 length:936 start_codon:yes stop_codon:yes gene_type:complete
MSDILEELPALSRSYGLPASIVKTELNTESLYELEKISGDLPDIDWFNPNLDERLLLQIREALQSSSSQLLETLEIARETYNREGFCVFSLGPDIDRQDIDIIKKNLICLLSLLGSPFGAFFEKGFWQTLGVNQSALSYRAESTGYIPLHMDFDQASNPPDGVALFCLRPDPRGGGENTIFNYERFFELLSAEQLEQLRSVSYSYSTLYNQNGIGDLYNPHPLVDQKLFRYNGKVMPELDDPRTSLLFSALESYFKSASSIYKLEKGDMIVINQHKALHGRLPLAVKENVEYTAGTDRFLLQTYVRHCTLM